jgi:hypothetical protein
MYPLGSAGHTSLRSETTRVNVDYTITPTLLMHLGFGFVDLYSDPTQKTYDPVSGLGFTGTYASPPLMPNFTGLSGSVGGLSTGIGAAGPDLDRHPHLGSQQSHLQGRWGSDRQRIPFP